ncbi:MAG: ATP-binding protein [Termitinemataceae bacterium]|nr:MAG: ATP-binding protein [Termitinemataceae bacterium]
MMVDAQSLCGQTHPTQTSSSISKTVRSLKCKIGALTVFESLKQQAILRVLYRISKEIDADNVNCLRLVSFWSKFVSLVTNYTFLHKCVKPTLGVIFFDIVFDLTIHNENAWTLMCEKNEKNAMLDELASLDIKKLFDIASLDICELSATIAQVLQQSAAKSSIEYDIIQNIIDEGKAFDILKKDHINKKNFNINYVSAFIKQNGAGIFSDSPMFYYSPTRLSSCASHQCSRLQSPSNADTITIKDLFGYEQQRQIIVSNTIAFLEGKSANNILLYGDRGTGKSATVKAVCNEYADRGLRLIEVRKNQLKEISSIVEMLKVRQSSANLAYGKCQYADTTNVDGKQLKFILFTDDLSFENENGEFNMLKAYMEGGIEKQPANIVFYATSNRRHLLKENGSDRPRSQSDVRAFDTMQEQLSLSDRFGVTVIFSTPSQDEYLNIALFLARNNGILKNDADAETINQFKSNALRWEKWFNGRSPRTALQFATWAGSGLDFPWV